MEQEIISRAIEYGSLGLITVVLIFYILKTTDQRELRFHDTLEKFNNSLKELASAFQNQSTEIGGLNNKIEKIEDELQEIKHKMN
ncbi:MAG: BhlA/UviB family holin-like peptide [Bacilli bacterium]|uniref:BhlA/UviB family holin-like peptide n=1 Tax=Clostridium sp. TaxID=1506 RepID=UPI002FC829CA